MQPVDRPPLRPPLRPPSRSSSNPRHSAVSPPLARGLAEAPLDPAFAPVEDVGAGGAPLHVAAPALLVAARFGDVPLATRLLRSDEPGAFTIGAARGADSPVNPAWLPTGATAEGGPPVEATPFRLVSVERGVFSVNLAPAMRAELRTPLQRLALGPDQGRAEAPLVIPPESHLRIGCGEVTFEIRATEPAASVPKPWLPAGWREEWPYPAAVALAALLLLGLLRAVPADPHALSLDDIAAAHRWDRMRMIPVQVPPVMTETGSGPKAAEGSGAPAANKPRGEVGDRNARRADARMATKGPARPDDARAAAARVRSNPLLVALASARTGALAEVLSTDSALGAEKDDVVGHLTATLSGGAYGGGLADSGTGDGGGGTGERLTGEGALRTIGMRDGGGPGGSHDHGRGVGLLAGRQIRHPPEVVGCCASVRGSLDREIIRRIVRRHLNEVRFCYDEALVARPTLAGRVVVQFSIAPTGRVLASLLQSSTLGATAAEACIVNAVKRWEFPAPEGGGLVMVSYPFQLAPVGG